MTIGTATVVRGDARHLPFPDNSVDLICTSPPYWSLRSYTDGGQHYDGQIGAEPTPAEYIDNLIACTAEWARVLKPTGSMWINLGDKYTNRSGGKGWGGEKTFGGDTDRAGEVIRRRTTETRPDTSRSIGLPEKTLIGLPWRYAIRCIDQLGLILRAEIIWAKPNGLPESVTDRVRRSHETWFHFVRSPRYYAAVDTIREPHESPVTPGRRHGGAAFGVMKNGGGDGSRHTDGKLPGSVWTIPTQPLTVPAHLGVDHFAAFPMEWPRRIINGWSPAGICTACGEGRRPIVESMRRDQAGGSNAVVSAAQAASRRSATVRSMSRGVAEHTITGESCACPDTEAPTRTAVVLDPFGGTGTTALVATALARHGISVDASADYCRLARWRVNDPGQLAAALQVDKPVPQLPDQTDLFDAFGAPG